MVEYDAFADVYDDQFGAVSEDLAFYIKEANEAPPPVLELACGTGRITLPVALQGIATVGIDSSAGMLAKAREKVARLNRQLTRDLPVRFVQADMRDFQLDERFGLALIPARSFLHLLDPEDQIQALCNIREHLIPGGRLALALFVPNLTMIAEHRTTTSEMLQFVSELTESESGSRVAVWGSRRYDVHRQRIYQRFRYETLDADGLVVATRYREFTLCYIWPRELQHLLARCGFETEAVYGSFDREPLHARSTEQIWVARKP